MSSSVWCLRNWPLNQIGAKLAPALIAGCTVVLKPSEVTPINAYLVAEAIHAAGLPRGVFNMVMGTGPACGEPLAHHPKVDMVSFTGSTVVGRKLHAIGASSIKRVRSELGGLTISVNMTLALTLTLIGGKSASIILPDATPKQIAMMSRHVIGNTGQSCNALSRMLVPTSRYDEACDIAKQAFQATNVVAADDPGAKITDIGPLASEQQYTKVRGYIQRGLDEGARLIVGGLDRPPGVPDGGYFVAPTVFADVENSMSIAQEEIFGPVLSIIPYETEEQAVEIANDTIFGLNNAVAGANQEHAIAVASLLRSGQVQVNTTAGSSKTPFGGYKQSGDGREWGEFGIDDMLQIKAINTPPPPRKKTSRL